MPTDGEAIHQARALLVDFLRSTRATVGYCTVSSETADGAKSVGIWRCAEGAASPAWEAAEGHVTAREFRKVERFLREAEAAEAMAKLLTDTDLRKAFEDLADQWRDMARRVEPSGRK